MSKKSILITGGAGFIGSHLAEKFIADGYIVKVLDDFSSGSVGNVYHLFNYRTFKLIKGDVTQKEILIDATRDCSVIFHLAAQIHVDKSIIEPERTMEINTIGTLNVLEAVMRNDVEVLIYASTSEVYGSALYVPMDEKHEMNPASPYAASKAAADRLCFSYYNTYQLPLVIVRCFNTFGPRQADAGYAAVIPQFIRRVLQGLPPLIYGDGKQTRDYMYVKDAVKAYSLVFESAEKLLGKTINFGSGSEVSINKLADTIIKLCGYKGKMSPAHIVSRPGEVKRLYADITNAKNLLGFKPEYSLEKGLGELIEWYRQGKYEEWRAYHER